MKFPLPHHHGAMLLKYSGISFISGAVNHGFFSGERSLWTAAIGIVLFVLGAVLEHRLSDAADEPPASLARTMTLGTLLSIGLGFFTGGLQHFPDSPARSGWVVPLGFFVSVLALALQDSHPWRRSSAIYGLVGGALITALSVAAWQGFERYPQWSALGDHAHGSHDEAAAANSPIALKIDRSLAISMNDQMRFSPDVIEVSAGETVRLVLHNAGQAVHEFVLGSDEQIAEHARDMAQNPAHHDDDHHGIAAITVAPGATGELIVRFPHAARYQVACLIPGHYQAGMRGRLEVIEASAEHHDAH